MAKKTTTTPDVAPKTDSSSVYSIRAVERVCDILDLLQRSREGVSLADVAAVTSLPKSSVFRYLSALEARRYVDRDSETALYRVGLSFQPHDTRQLEAFLAQAEGPLRRLRDDLGETTNLGTLDGPMVVHSLVFESNQMMRLAARVGDRAPDPLDSARQGDGCRNAGGAGTRDVGRHRDDAVHLSHDHRNRGVPFQAR